MNFDNKTVVITGASSGIGRALAFAFAGRGANVVLGARREDCLRQVAEDIASQGGSVQYHVTDVTDPESCKKLMETATNHFGGIDILVCNAGVSMRALFDDVDLSVLHNLMNVNFWGCVNCVKYALPFIQKSKGTVVGLSSVAGLHGLPCRTGYSAAKYALTGFLETLRIENMRKGVRVMIACPGFTATDVRCSALTADGAKQRQSPRKECKMMRPEEVAERIIRGIMHKKRLLTMESSGRLTRFIKMLYPSLLDRLYYKAMAKEPNSPLN